MREAALAWAARGFRVFRCKPGRKEPVASRWFAEATSNPEEIERMWARDYNVGVLCDDMIVVDCDVKHGKQGLASFIDLELPGDTLAVKTPTGGVHFYLAGPSTRNRAEIAPGVDIRSAHGYVLAPGSRLAPGVYNTCPAGGEYVLWQDAEMQPCPQEFVERIGAPRERQSSNPLVDLDTEANVALAVEYLEDQAEPAIEGCGGDQTTFAAACGVRDFGISEDLCYELMLDHYNDRCAPPWEPDHLRIKVENAYTYALGQPGAKSPGHLFEGVSVPEPEYRKPAAPKSAWIRAGDPVVFDRQWLLFDKLPRVGTALMVAPSNAGKTFLTLELARALATGETFFGSEPDEKVGTIILAAEGVAGLGSRMSTLGDLPVAARPVGLLCDEKTVERLTKEIAEEAERMELMHGTRLGLIVVDTLAASGLLSDENSNTECAKAVKALERWAMHFGCLVMATHHPPKNGSGARGASALHAGVDTVVEIFHEPGREVRYVECTKSREARTGKWGSFTLIPRTIGFDSRGREVTTCEVSMGTETKVVIGKMPKHYDRFIEALEHARVDEQIGKREKVPKEAARAAFGRIVHFKGGTGSATNAFKECVAWGEKSGGLEIIIENGQEFFSDQAKEE